MAWHSGKPADGDFLSASVQHIRENFAELEPLQPHVSEIVDLTALHPHITELVDLTALHPYIDALLSSRIVDHNLDVPNPPNGWYVRWGNGLQVCFRAWGPWGTDDLSEMQSATWTFPAAFSSAPFAVLATPAPAGPDQTRMIVSVSRWSGRTATSVNVFARAIEPMTLSTQTVEMVAIGVWS